MSSKWIFVVVLHTSGPVFNSRFCYTAFSIKSVVSWFKELDQIQPLDGVTLTHKNCSWCVTQMPSHKKGFYDVEVV